MSNRFIKLGLVLLAFCLPLPAMALNVFACEPQWAALSKALGAGHVDMYQAIDASQDPHHVQARPSLIIRVHRADLVACTGGGLEVGWLPVLLNQGNNVAVTHAPGLFYADKQIQLKNVPTSVDRALGDIHPYGNPHAHLDPHRLLKVAAALSARFVKLDSANASDYRQAFDQFSQRWKQSIKHWQKAAAPLKGMPVIVHHEEWIYLLDWLGINRAGELEPKPGLPPTPSHLADLVNVVKASGAKLIIYAPHNSPDASRWLADHTTACAVQLPFTVGGTEAADDLFSLYTDTINRLLKARKACHG